MLRKQILLQHVGFMSCGRGSWGSCHVGEAVSLEFEKEATPESPSFESEFHTQHRNDLEQSLACLSLSFLTCKLATTIVLPSSGSGG